jgi:hypothetical protein
MSVQYSGLPFLRRAVARRFDLRLDWQLIRRTLAHVLGTSLLVGAAFAVRNASARTGEKPSAPYAVPEPVPEPRVFAEGIISTVDDEAGATFSPDGTDFYFTVTVPYTTFPHYGVICVSHFSGGKWGKPEVVSFSGKNFDIGPKLSPDGKKMFFASSRPAAGHSEHVLRIWSVEKTANGWGEPQPLPEPVNAPANRWNIDPSVTRDGTLYFASDREEPFHFQIYRSRFVDGKYVEAEKLGPAINWKYADAQPYISPDEKILIFSSTAQQVFPYEGRPGDQVSGGRPYPRGDLYISVRQNGEWTPARHLEHGINSPAEETYPALTPDGRYLFFGSERSDFTVPVAHRLDHDAMERGLHSIFNGHGNIFFIDATALDIPGQATKP